MTKVRGQVHSTLQSSSVLSFFKIWATLSMTKKCRSRKGNSKACRYQKLHLDPNRFSAYLNESSQLTVRFVMLLGIFIRLILYTLKTEFKGMEQLIVTKKCFITGNLHFKVRRFVIAQPYRLKAFSDLLYFVVYQVKYRQYFLSSDKKPIDRL